MATKHVCTSWTSSLTGRELLILKTAANNIQLVNLASDGKPTGQKISNTTYYGMNASWFAEESAPSIDYPNDSSKNVTFARILNIAYQGGSSCGVTSSKNTITSCGNANQVGNCIIYYKNNALGYAEGVTSDNDSRVPKTSTSWVQGGLGLYLGDKNWLSKVKECINNMDNDNVHVEDFTSDANARTAMLVNLNTNEVYLIACIVITTTLSDFRNSIMDYIGLSDGESNTEWRAIMLDGGASAQIVGSGMSRHRIGYRAVPQMIALKNKQ